jgi:hypothetical protein
MTPLLHNIAFSSRKPVLPQVGSISEGCNKSTSRRRQVVEDYSIAMLSQHPADEVDQSFKVQGVNMAWSVNVPDSASL